MRKSCGNKVKAAATAPLCCFSAEIRLSVEITQRSYLCIPFHTLASSFPSCGVKTSILFAHYTKYLYIYIISPQHRADPSQNARRVESVSASLVGNVSAARCCLSRALTGKSLLVPVWVGEVKRATSPSAREGLIRGGGRLSSVVSKCFGGVYFSRLSDFSLLSAEALSFAATKSIADWSRLKILGFASQIR